MADLGCDKYEQVLGAPHTTGTTPKLNVSQSSSVEFETGSFQWLGKKDI